MLASLNTTFLHVLSTSSPPFPTCLYGLINHPSCRLSDSLVAARLVVTATNKLSWARALGSFWFIFQAIESALDSHSNRAGKQHQQRTTTHPNESPVPEDTLAKCEERTECKSPENFTITLSPHAQSEVEQKKVFLNLLLPAC